MSSLSVQGIPGQIAKTGAGWQHPSVIRLLLPAGCSIIVAQRGLRSMRRGNSLDQNLRPSPLPQFWKEFHLRRSHGSSSTAACPPVRGVKPK